MNTSDLCLFLFCVRFSCKQCHARLEGEQGTISHHLKMLNFIQTKNSMSRNSRISLTCQLEMSDVDVGRNVMF